jgi:uncharacterized lipoprotein YajG
MRSSNSVNSTFHVLRAAAIIGAVIALAGCSDPPVTSTTTTSQETTAAPAMMVPVPSTVTTRTTNTQTMPYGTMRSNNQ